jgi:hypothetical protein
MKLQTPEYVTHDAINGQKVRRLNMPLASASEGQGARDMGFDGFFLSAEFIRRLGIWKGEPSGEPNLSASCEVQCRNTATQNYSPLAIRYSLSAT